jgi:hypothetical protein
VTLVPVPAEPGWGRAGISPARLAQAARRVLTVLFLGVLPVAFTCWFGYYQARLGVLNFDFEGTIWEAGRRILDGRSPYPAATAEALGVGNPAVYPAPVLVAAAPLAALPLAVAGAVWLALLAAAGFLTLWILGVRDWRCYGVALASFPVLHALTLGNVTILLVLAAAVAWRYRDRTWVVAAAVALAVAVKIFLWPLVVWLLATRRFRAAAVAVAGAGVVTLGAWGAIGFAGLREYPQLLDALSAVYAPPSHSLFSAGLGLGLGDGGAHALALVGGGAVLLAAALVGRRRGGDEASFSLALGAALLLSPIVWPHYFALLLVPLAILQPRLGRLWALPAAFWVVVFLPRPSFDGCCRPPGTPAEIWEPLQAGPAMWHTAGYTLVLAATLAIAVLHGRRPRAFDSA